MDVLVVSSTGAVSPTVKSQLTYQGPDVLRANQLFRAELDVKLGLVVHPGGRIVIATRHVSDFGDPQMVEAGAENYITVQPGGPGRWNLGPLNDWRRHPWNRGIPDVLPVRRKNIFRMGHSLFISVIFIKNPKSQKNYIFRNV